MNITPTVADRSANGYYVSHQAPSSPLLPVASATVVITRTTDFAQRVSHNRMEVFDRRAIISKSERVILI